MVLLLINPVMLLIATVVLVSGGLVINYVKEVAEYRRSSARPGVRELPPKHPTWIPYLGAIIPLLWDLPSCLEGVMSCAGKLASSRLAIGPQFDLFLFQGQDTVKEIWKKSAVMCAGKVHVFACKNMFGMTAKTLSRYAADDSGPFAKPYPGSHILPQDRIHRLLNTGIDRALTGPGLEPKLQRFRQNFMAQIEQLNSTTSSGWIEIEDLHKFIHHTLGLSIIQAIFGLALVNLNPTFMDDLFEFEHWFPWLARGIPAFIRPKPYAVRRRLHSHFKNWYSYTREHFDEKKVGADGDEDPFWGSEWMRERQQSLAVLQDEDSLAAGDLGVAWASLSNIVAASALILLHVVQSEDLTHRVRQEVASSIGHQSLGQVNLKELSRNPLLASVYAETLRLHVKTFTIVSSPLEDLSIGKFWFPKRNLGLVNSWLAHTDEDFWNTRNGRHPLTSFWPERFLTDPTDSSSGPCKSMRQKPEQPDDKSPFFSLKGLEGSWIPYGGGHLICPGRFLAKNIMIFACALLTQEFEFEIHTQELQYSSRNYGFGISMPKQPIAVRMRRRT